MSSYVVGTILITYLWAGDVISFQKERYEIVFLFFHSMFVTYSCDSKEFPSVLSRPLKGLKLLFVIFPEIFFILLPKLTWNKKNHEIRDFNRQIFPQKFWVKSESTPVFLSKNLSLKRKIATNFNSRQKCAFRTNIEFSRKCIYLQFKPI